MAAYGMAQVYPPFTHPSTRGARSPLRSTPTWAGAARAARQLRKTQNFELVLRVLPLIFIP